jgi:hypothetical protein
LTTAAAQSRSSRVIAVSTSFVAVGADATVGPIPAAPVDDTVTAAGVDAAANATTTTTTPIMQSFICALL